MNPQAIHPAGDASLAQQQQALLAALWEPTVEAGIQALGVQVCAGATPQRVARGLHAYRANGAALAQRALTAAYPVLAQLIAEDNFVPLARLLWRTHPPLRGDLAQWGAALADVVQAAPQLATMPYLADVARTEWALHCAASAANATQDPASLHWLMQHEPSELTLRLSPGTALVASTWPVVSIVLAHGAGGLLEQAAERLSQRSAETALVWRQGYKPQLRQTEPGEAALLAALQGGATLAQAWDRAPGLDFSTWLTQAYTSGLVTGVARVQTL